MVYRRTPEGPEFALIKADGKWSLPKGNMEKGEQPEDTALREISEETGLPRDQLHLVSRLPDINYAFQWKGVLAFKVVYGYLVELAGEGTLQPQLSEIEDVQWFAADAARKVISFKNSLATLNAAIAGLDDLRKAS